MAAVVADKGNAATSVYNPYRIFLAAQRSMGDPSVVAKVLVELLGDCAGHDVLMGSAASVLDMYYGARGARLSAMTDFGKFAGELADELGKRDSPEAEERMKEAQSVYELFEEADVDSNGTISKEEFVNFGSNVGVDTEDEALELFKRVDTDNNGVISFLEWLQFCVPGAGRDKDSFNCAGHHGLRSWDTTADGIVCCWCKETFPSGSRMFACRECDCDACFECTVSHLASCTSRVFCERPGPPVACTLSASSTGGEKDCGDEDPAE